MHIQGKLWRLDQISINHQTTETPSKPCFDMFSASCFQLYFQQLEEKWKKVKKSTRRSHCDAYTRQIVKISKKHQTTEMLPNHVLTCSQLLVFTFNSNNHKKSEKSTRRSHYDAYTRQIVKTSALPPNNRNAFQTMFWHVLSFLFSTLIPATRRKVKKKVPVGAILMHIHGKLWRLAYITKQQKRLPSHVLPCSKLPFFNYISSN